MPFCPPVIDDKIEELYRESLVLREKLSLAVDKKRRETIERDLEVIYRLIAEYSQMGANMTIEGETPVSSVYSIWKTCQLRCPLQES